MERHEDPLYTFEAQNSLLKVDSKPWVALILAPKTHRESLKTIQPLIQLSTLNTARTNQSSVADEHSKRSTQSKDECVQVGDLRLMRFEPAVKYQSQAAPEAPKSYTEAMRKYFLLPQDSRLLKITVKGGKLKLASSNCSSNYQSQREEQGHYKPMSQRVKLSAERQSSAGGSAVASERGEATNPPQIMKIR